MYIELLSKSDSRKLSIWKSFLNNSDIEPDNLTDTTVLIWDNDILIATGSRYNNLLKLIAVDKNRQGEGLTATVITELKKDAFSNGIRHLFLYTKPQNRAIFSDLFFYPVAQTENVLLMEDKRDGIVNFLNQFPDANEQENNGCIVANCNPFTSGHLYLIEKAAKECDNLYIFVVWENLSRFSNEDRMEMVIRGTSHIPNVKVLPTGPYLISSSTFPSYFLKDRENVTQIKCFLDIEIFTKYYAPKFNIKTRYVGTEPLSPLTLKYNNELKKYLPKNNIALKEFPRLEISDMPISAGRVRDFIDSKDIKALKSILPDTTYSFLQNKGII